MERIQPAWLHDMIYAEFNTTSNRQASEKAYFCVDCGGETLTRTEIETEHKKHKIFRGIKNNGQYCYLKDDILSLGSKVLDISWVCVYTANSTAVIFPRSSSDINQSRKGSSGCLCCGKHVRGKALYCSILCKLVSNEDKAKPKKTKVVSKQESLKGLSLNKSTIKNKNTNVGESSEIKHGDSVILQKETQQVNNKRKNDAKLENLVDVVQGEVAGKSYRKRPRKGIPRRAPFF